MITVAALALAVLFSLPACAAFEASPTCVCSSGGTTLVDYDHDALGRRSKLTRANGAVTTLGYDDASRLSSLNHDLPGTADDQNFAFTYTAASQLASQSATDDTYTWITPAASRSYVRNGLNQYSSVSGQALTHDGRGNLTGDGSRTLGYDLENRLVSVSGPASLGLSHDPAGRLRQLQSGASSTQWLHSGRDLVGEYQGATLLRRHVPGAGSDEPLVQFEGAGFTDPRYLIADRLGSIIAVNGASSTRQRYGPWGEPEAWAGSRFGYTGQARLPEAQLYHYKARAYDPLLGRFLQTDPVGYDEDLNLYAYVKNDPLNAVDPEGEVAFLIPVLVMAYRAYSAYDTVRSSVESVQTLRSQSASGTDKTLAALDLASNLFGGKAGGTLADGVRAVVNRTDDVREAARGADDAVDAFRAVSRAEADDIAKHGFRPNPSGRGFQEGKWFSETREGAETFRRNFSDLDEVVQTRVPRSVYDRSVRHPNIDNTGPGFCVQCADLPLLPRPR